MKYPPGSAREALLNSRPISKAADGAWLNAINLKNHSAVTELVQGRGGMEHLRTVMHMHNTTRALLLMGFGVDLADIILNSDKAIKDIVGRVQTKGSYTLYASEILALNAILELHDAQMKVATIGEVNQAISNTEKEYLSGNCIRFSTKYIGEPA